MAFGHLYPEPKVRRTFGTRPEGPLLGLRPRNKIRSKSERSEIAVMVKKLYEVQFQVARAVKIQSKTREIQPKMDARGPFKSQKGRARDS